MKEAREAAMAAHDRKVSEMNKLAKDIADKNTKETEDWLEEQLAKIKAQKQETPEQAAKRKEEEEKQKKIKELQEQLTECSVRL